MTAAKKQLGEKLLLLQRWLAAPGPCDLVLPSSVDLDVKSILEQGALPWQHATAAAGLLALRKAELAGVSTKLERSQEELCIVQREAADMVSFYEFYRDQILISAMPHEEHAVLPAQRLPPELAKRPEAARAAYQAGRLQILRSKLNHFQARLEAAQDARAYMQGYQSMPAASAQGEGIDMDDDLYETASPSSASDAEEDVEESGISQ